MAPARFAMIVLVACLPSCATVERSSQLSFMSRVSGSMRVVGDISEDFPCTKVKSVLAQGLEYGVNTCKAVPLEFTPRGSRIPRPVFDLWVATGNESMENEVVDFYETVTLGEVGDISCGRFELQTYTVDGKKIAVLERQIVERPCPN
ncbi:hypothetical protein [Sphingomonas sp. GB1N7]|uniref:hypothetical protein n=1 Tax=Parasphingomonas caseinilytica TaxID=3096158 RepID=UPI002FCBA37D